MIEAGRGRRYGCWIRRLSPALLSVMGLILVSFTQGARARESSSSQTSKSSWKPQSSKANRANKNQKENQDKLVVFGLSNKKSVANRLTLNASELTELNDVIQQTVQSHVKDEVDIISSRATARISIGSTNDLQALILAAKRVNATLFIWGQIFQIGPKVTVRMKLYEVQSGKLLKKEEMGVDALSEIRQPLAQASKRLVSLFSGPSVSSATDQVPVAIPYKAKSKAGPAISSQAADRAFKKAEVVHKSFCEIKFQFPLFRLKKSLVSKGKKLLAAQKLYSKVLKYKDSGASTAALYRISEMFEIFGRGLLDLPLPKGLSEEEIDVYRAELKDKAEPLIKKAAIGYESGSKFIKKHGVKSEWSRQLQRRLNIIRSEHSLP